MKYNSKLSPYKVKKIIRFFCVDVNATKTAQLLGLNRNTINRWFNIFRLEIYIHQLSQFEQMYGVIEVDESYFGSKRIRGHAGKRGRGTSKQPVFGIFERGGRVFTEIVPDCKARTLKSLIMGKVDLDSVIYSDGWRGYDGLVDVGYSKHLRVNHGQNEFARGSCHINGIESFWSFTKRRLLKFNGVSINFEWHLKECEWRWNRSVEELEAELWKMIR